MMRSKRTHKYAAVPVYICTGCAGFYKPHVDTCPGCGGDVRRFDSKREGRRYLDLRILRSAGKITDLELQPSFDLMAGDVHLRHQTGRKIRYIADFAYTDLERGGVRVVEDAKGMKTDVYKLKRAIMEAMGFTIVEV